MAAPSYECFGAGQHVTQVVYAGATWRGSADGGAEMFAVFAVVQRLHEMLVLLDQASALAPGPGLTRLRERVSGRTSGRPEDILDTELDRLAVLVGEALRGVSRSVRGDGPTFAGHDLVGQDLRAHDLGRADLRGAVLIAADLRDVVLDRTDLLGADLRDCRPLRRRPLDRAVPHPAPAQLGSGECGHPVAIPPAAASRLAHGLVPSCCPAALRAGVVGDGGVVRIAGGALSLLHLCLEEVSLALHELVACLALEVAERRPVGVVVLLHELEGPAAVEDVATDELGVDPVRQLLMAGLAQQVDRLAESPVGGAGVAVEGVQVAAAHLDRLEGL